jgi:hypothetical protein
MKLTVTVHASTSINQYKMQCNAMQCNAMQHMQYEQALTLAAPSEPAAIWPAGASPQVHHLLCNPRYGALRSGSGKMSVGDAVARNGVSGPLNSESEGSSSPIPFPDAFCGVINHPSLSVLSQANSTRYYVLCSLSTASSPDHAFSLFMTTAGGIGRIFEAVGVTNRNSQLSVLFN